MALQFLKSNDRGRFQFDWLNSFHSFSFGHYYDPNRMGHFNLRVINEDFVNAKSGFDTHPHKDMEIITFMLEGVLTHQDSMGNRKDIKKGEVQIMTAGTGVRHSEWNHTDATTHLLQIWALPSEKDLAPRYLQEDFTDILSTEGIQKIAGTTTHFPLKLLSHLDLYHLNLNEQKNLTIENKGAGLYAHLYEGSAVINGTTLNAGDAFYTDGVGLQNIDIQTRGNVKALIFESLI